MMRDARRRIEKDDDERKRTYIYPTSDGKGRRGKVGEDEEASNFYT